MNNDNDLNLYSMTKLSGWLCYCFILNVWASFWVIAQLYTTVLCISKSMPVYLDFLQVTGKKLQLALCGSNLPTLLELVKPHNTC